MRKGIAALVATAALAFGACGEEDTGGAPNVQGLSLPAAKRQLKKAGYNADASPRDATFGVIVEENWIVCDQEEPQGKLVPLDVAKDC